MDVREFYAAYRSDGWGAAAYDPGMMVAILLYAYCPRRHPMGESTNACRELDDALGLTETALGRSAPVKSTVMTGSGALPDSHSCSNANSMRLALPIADHLGTW